MLKEYILIIQSKQMMQPIMDALMENNLNMSSGRQLI